MSKKIIVESKNGADNIDKSRRKTNISNLEEDKKDWKKIVDDGDKTNQIIPTLLSRLEKNYEYYGFEKPGDIEFKDIQQLAKKYIEADPWLQINYCRDSTRQSIDESVQAATLKKFVNDSFQTIPNGKEVLYEGTIVSKKEAAKLSGKIIKARSIDCIGIVGTYNAKGFLKYSKVSGSGQLQQRIETQNWLEECLKITGTNILFFAQLDGEEAESHIDELRKIVENHKNIFVGNTEQVIDWLNSVK